MAIERITISFNLNNPIHRQAFENFKAMRDLFIEQYPQNKQDLLEDAYLGRAILYNLGELFNGVTLVDPKNLDTTVAIERLANYIQRMAKANQANYDDLKNMLKGGAFHNTNPLFAESETPPDLFSSMTFDDEG